MSPANYQNFVPNFITYTRFFLVPVLLCAYLAGYHSLMAPVFIVAAISDFLDGFLARRWKVESALGAFLDPVADKLIVTCALIILVDLISSSFMVSCVTLIILREVAMSSLRQWASSFAGIKDISVSILGKMKTALQLVGISILLSSPSGYWLFIGQSLLALSAILAWVSYLQYHYKALSLSSTV